MSSSQVLEMSFAALQIFTEDQQRPTQLSQAKQMDVFLIEWDL